MPAFFKPNSRNTGSACSFTATLDKTDSVFLNFIKQASWDVAKKTGSFKANKNKPETSCCLKLNFNELGGILECLEKNREFSTFHTSKFAKAKQSINLTFKPYMAKGTDDGVEKQVGFSLWVHKEIPNMKTNFLIGFTFAEARHLKAYLTTVMNTFYSRNILEAQSRFQKTSDKPVPKLSREEETEENPSEEESSFDSNDANLDDETPM